MPDTLAHTTLRLPRRLLALADRRAAALGWSRTKYIERLIRRDLFPRQTEKLPPAQHITESVFG